MSRGFWELLLLLFNSAVRPAETGERSCWGDFPDESLGTLTSNDRLEHVAIWISLFSKSHDCGQIVAHVGPVPIPAEKGVSKSGEVTLSVFSECVIPTDTPIGS